MKQSKSPLASLLLVLVTLLAGLGCGGTETRTQLTFEIAASAELQGRLRSLRVVVRSNNRGDQTQDFTSADLDWPVQIVVIPERGNDSTDEVTLFATAYDASREQLGASSAVAKFMPGRARTINLALDGEADGGTPDGGRNEPVPDSGPPPGPVPDAGGDEPAPDAGMSVVNCETSSAIKCDDGDRCNGTETCAVGSANADDKGCLKGTDIKTCAAGTRCDAETGECSSCKVNDDGDGDTFKSVTCGGQDCDDNDPEIAPGKTELCDGKDNNCDKVVDGDAANGSCASLAPMGGVATCGTGGSCVRTCNTMGHVINGNVCEVPPGTCPAVNPCAPGTCTSVQGGFACECGAGYRTGLAKNSCVKQGSRQAIGFETTCDGTTDPFGPAPGAASQPVSPLLYAPCGLSSISTTVMGAQPVLVRPTMMAPEGLTGTTALASGSPAVGPSQVTFSFTTPINTISFDVLGVAEPMMLSVVATVGGVDGAAMMPTATMGSTALRFTGTYAMGATRVVISYAPAAVASSLEFFVDALTFSVAGCGDMARSPAEGCDDGNSVQCDGCDNACLANLPGTNCMP
jgi:cysteine-rich repeat protein